MHALLVPGTSPAAGSARACLDVDCCAFAVGAPARVTVTAGSSTAVLLCWLSAAPRGAPASLDARVTAAGSPLTAADLAQAAAAGCELSCDVRPLSPRAPAATRVRLAGVSPDATAPGLAAALAGLPVEAGACIAPGGAGVAWRVVGVAPAGGVCRVTKKTVVETE